MSETPNIQINEEPTATLAALQEVSQLLEICVRVMRNVGVEVPLTTSSQWTARQILEMPLRSLRMDPVLWAAYKRGWDNSALKIHSVMRSQRVRTTNNNFVLAARRTLMTQSRDTSVQGPRFAVRTVSTASASDAEPVVPGPRADAEPEVPRIRMVFTTRPPQDNN